MRNRIPHELRDRLRQAHHDHEHRQFAFGGRPGFPPMPGFGPGFGPGPHGRRGGGRGRGRRGNVRAAILGLLAERPMHGYEMISELESRTGGVWRPSPGSVYPTLQLLEDEGLIEATESTGRKSYALTEAGRTAAEAEPNRAPWQEFTADEVNEAQDFRQAGFGIMQALHQVGATGTPEQRARALEILNDTRRKLYAILAEE
ncbi:DNA-binding PadR family transcriptional regulator [Hamadaea flava]|uniref:PadR family transcriptional regulator n=1 Tax=Hamadaea flava TaxID=1742688 RepID=A0ABV8LKD0_9ACTN|nr:DNA-binding PadR family transcriptional regulator [Hamadaea flava]